MPQANQKTLLKLISRVFLCLISKPNENENESAEIGFNLIQRNNYRYLD